MKYTRAIPAVLLIFFSLLAIASYAQNKDFSGNWQFKEQESISGKLYSNGSPKVVKITQSAGQVVIESTTAGQNGDITSSVTLAFDGKPAELKTSSGKRKVLTLNWNGTSSFTTVASVYNLTDTQKLDFKTTDTYTIEGGSLVLQRKAENFTNSEVWESKAYYEK